MNAIPLAPLDARTLAREAALRRHLDNQPWRIVIGAGGVFEPGWIPTDAREFDLLRPETWERFVPPGSVDALMAEHVWEHLTLDEGRTAARTCLRFLKPGGHLRVAVPDGLFPSAEFQEYIKIGGKAGGGVVGGHQIVYTYSVLREVFDSAGFETTLLEYHDEHGQFHGVDWDPADGKIHRSLRFDERGPISVILDARKPLAAR
jgi:predicted SAM-dependent methyltransferase